MDNTIYVSKVGKKIYVDVPSKQYSGAFSTPAKAHAFLKPAILAGWHVVYSKDVKPKKNPSKRRNAMSKVPYGYGAHDENPKKAAKKKAGKKRPVNLNMIAGAVNSKKTPKHLKDGLLKKYGAQLKAKGLI